MLVSGGGRDNAIRIWDTFKNQEVRILKGHSSPVRTLTFINDTSILASSGDDGIIFLWDWNRITQSID
ncbi:hypothetical protein JT359_10460 [Candidatus Poribacteria bacterium]|nr:hypothetical protein [Candidatus Poribacteria bacterium]